MIWHCDWIVSCIFLGICTIFFNGLSFAPLFSVLGCFFTFVIELFVEKFVSYNSIIFHRLISDLAYIVGFSFYIMCQYVIVITLLEVLIPTIGKSGLCFFHLFSFFIYFFIFFAFLFLFWLFEVL